MTKAKTSSPLTRNQRKKMSEVPSEVKLRKILPEVPRDESERGELLEDLQVLGCSGFLEKPWGFKDDKIVRELLDGVSNEFENSIRAQPVKWTEETWREVYRFSKGGVGLAGRKDEFVKGCFKELPNPKDGYDRGLQGSPTQATAGVLDPHRLSGKAKPDYSYVGKHHLRSTERKPEGELGACNDEPHRPACRARG
jgi:hypothetical protein